MATAASSRWWRSTAPSCNGPSTSLIHDVGHQKLPVTFRARFSPAIVGADGPPPTPGSVRHQLSARRPQLHRLWPPRIEGAELQPCSSLSIHHNGPCALGIPRGEGRCACPGRRKAGALESAAVSMLADGVTADRRLRRHWAPAIGHRWTVQEGRACGGRSSMPASCARLIKTLILAVARRIAPGW